MKIFLQNSSVICNAGEGETILTACARTGIILSAPCGGRRRCGKCKVTLLEGKVSGDAPDAEGRVRACAAVPVSDIVIANPESSTIIGSELSPVFLSTKKRPARAGVALDIGTTTVSARLVDLNTASALDTISELNDQRVFGADVMSRIAAARDGKTAGLFTAINRQTGKLIETFRKRCELSRIEKLTVSGNTTMLHLFLNVDPSGMGEIPFTPVFLEEREMKGESLSLPAEIVTLLPSVSAFIGGDITAGLAALEILEAPQPSLFIDIGTNGELALFNRGNILCCSTAAGPAFEGAEISCGLSGVNGAISAVELSDEASALIDAGAAGKANAAKNPVLITTIGNTRPRGICGSGLIDAVAVMLKLGIMDETGLMEESPSGFTIAPGVSLTNMDIRQFQLAKSAILSGIKILCRNAGVRMIEIKNVFIAGGFGFFINRRNAVRTGIFPAEFIDLLSVCGNLSLQGAEECLTTENFIYKCKQIIARCSIIDLAADPSFMDEFAANMLFGVPDSN